VAKLTTNSGTVNYPASHQLGMKVPKGGASCASCKFVSKDLLKCANRQFVVWNGSKFLPQKADEYCCDLYKIKPAAKASGPMSAVLAERKG